MYGTFHFSYLHIDVIVYFVQILYVPIDENFVSENVCTYNILCIGFSIIKIYIIYLLYW